LSACEKDDEQLDQRILLVGLWESIEVNMTFSVGEISLYQYYIDELGFTEEEAQKANQAYGDVFASGLIGFIEFENDNTFTSTLGPSIETGTWWIVNTTTLKLTEESQSGQIDLTIFSLDANNLVLGFDDANIDDINGDGTVEEIKIGIELLMRKVDKDNLN
jgi:hypothetical protein